MVVMSFTYNHKTVEVDLIQSLPFTDSEDYYDVYVDDECINLGEPLYLPFNKNFRQIIEGIVNKYETRVQRR